MKWPFGIIQLYPNNPLGVSREDQLEENIFLILLDILCGVYQMGPLDLALTREPKPARWWSHDEVTEWSVFHHNIDPFYELIKNSNSQETGRARKPIIWCSLNISVFVLSNHMSQSGLLAFRFFLLQSFGFSWLSYFGWCPKIAAFIWWSQRKITCQVQFISN